MSLSGRTERKPPPQEADIAAVAAHFHLPDLCRLQALLPLILVGQLLAIALTVADRPLPDFDWLHFSLLATEILWIELIGAALLCRLRPLLVHTSAPAGVALCFAVLLTVIALVAMGGQWLLSYFSPNWQESGWIVLQHLAVGGIIAGLALRYFYLQQQLHLQHQAQLEATMQARFQSLQSRIRPHFLFNSMNIIASLIDSDPEMAEHVIEDMSELFRASLSDAENLVPLSQEISLCERYIHIEQLRLGERLHVDWQKTLRSEKHLVPSLCLQPLVENAIYHGIQPRVAGGTITIEMDDANDRLAVCISNPVDDNGIDNPTNRKKRGNGMALDNLEQRLRARYGNSSRFAVTRAGQQFTVTFSIPTATTTQQTGGAA
jgi:two-component system sensor histidine kinase AlgZ